MEKIAFIDLEASGLGPLSWPIEVGWCFPDSSPQACLIRPAQDWQREAWDKKAEALHGIDFEQLQKQGEPISSVCARLNDALSGAVVYSDAPDWDGFWLYQLFTAGDARQAFTLRDFGGLLSELGADDVRPLLDEASRTAPHRHRASDDVLHMKTIYQLAKKRC